jgi:flagellar motor switch protein FliG
MADQSNNDDFTGADKAAIFLMSLGEEDAAQVFRHLGPKEVQAVGAAMATLNNVSKVHVADVLKDFSGEVGNQTALGVDSDNYIRKVLYSALGEDKASSLVDRILLGRNSKGIEALKWMDPRAVAEVIRLEHPQIQAIVLSHLEADHAAETLSYFSERARPDVMMRIASLDGIPPNALQELDMVLEKQFSGQQSLKTSSAGGVKSAANILNYMDSASESAVIEQIKEMDDALGQSIQDKMFVFDNLADIDDRGIQTLLREISSDVLAPALKAADQRVKDKIFKNMSKRGAEMLKDDLEVLGPVRLSEVEGAQREILDAARRLADAGELALGGQGGDEFV